MNKKMIIEKFFGFTEATYYNWRREGRPVIDFFEKYISDDDLIEFIKTGRLKRIEIDRDIDDEIEDFALKTAIYKIKNAKNLPYSLFLRILEDMQIHTKTDYLIAIDNIKLKLIEHSNWKNIIKEFVQNEMSNLEMKVLIKNKSIIKNDTNKTQQNED